MKTQNGQSSKTSIVPIRVGIVPLDGFAMMSFAATVEPLRAANRIAEHTLYNVRFIGLQRQIMSSGGAGIVADELIGSAASYDLLFVIAGSDVSGESLVSFKHHLLFHWLRFIAQQGVMLGGVSGGPAVLAQAGLMHERRMTIHWDHAQALSTLMPYLLLERSLYVRDRDRLTCAGGTAPLDMMHALFVEQQGADFARSVSDWFLHTDIRGSGDPQKSGVGERYRIRHQPLLDVIELMENHVADPLDLVQLARVVSLSPRHLNRLFQDNLDLSAIAFYRRLRLEKAHSLLLQSALSVTEIAIATGFCNTSHFGRCFRQTFACSPGELRLEK
jgi:transcriptional regulator GlxA family with amidase domain